MPPNATTPNTPGPPLGAGKATPWPDGRPGRHPDPLWWGRELAAISGVGPAVAGHARALGIVTVGDLLSHLPSRFEDFADGIRPLAALRAGEEATVRVVLDSITVQPTRRRKLVIVRARVHDQSGRLTLTWFNQRHLATRLQPGDVLLVRGRVGAEGRPEIAVRSHEVLGRGELSEGLHTTGLVPVYPASERLPARRLRELVDLARPLVRAVPETVPTWARVRLGRPPLADALMAAHFPRSRGEVPAARAHLALAELLVLQVGLAALRRRAAGQERAPRLVGDGSLTEAVIGALPYRLTAEQARAVHRIGADLEQPHPMRRLLQGEVGSGKTIVAVLAMCRAVEAGGQAALLAPTETLAEQHLRTLDQLLAPTGHAPVLLTGRIPKAERARRQLALATGTAPFAIGTQALLSEGVDFHRLGLVVVDEQHRFGVEQRQALAAQTAGSGEAAHLLYMTATPIPRTLALTDYGDLAVSTLRHRPPGRSAVTTTWLPEQRREEAYEALRSAAHAGRQGYVICPLVAEGAAAEARAATVEYERLVAGPLRGLRLGLAHGAQRADDRRAAMTAFAAGEIDVLVATTVVEVGIDVPNATVMVIEGADRFGLAQLHQLRGRVGRGIHEGRCILFGETTTAEGERRLEAIVASSDGFQLAEADLDIRDSGSLLGVRQSGPSDLRVARRRHHRLELAQARRLARWILRDDPQLEAPEHAALRAAVTARFAAIPRLLDA